MSKVEIIATNAAGKVFIGLAQIQWQPIAREDADKPFKLFAIHQFRIFEDDGSVIGLQRDFIKP